MAAARLALRITLGAYVAFLAEVGFYPSPVDRPVHEPLMHPIHETQQHGLHFITYPSVEFTANIFLFVPFGLLLALFFGPPRWWRPGDLFRGDRDHRTRPGGAAAATRSIGRGCDLPDYAVSRFRSAPASLHVTSNYRVDRGWQKAADKPFFT